jgi:arachidonate 15-lipoxygenase
MLVWEATKSWVSDFIAITYSSDAVVRADYELQAWAAEISASKGGQVKNFGQTPGGIGSREDLIDILTMIIFTAGPQHAAVNFPQATDSAFLPANPFAGYRPEIKSNTLTEADWLAFLPPLDIAIRQAHTGYFLGSVYHGRLGHYGNIFSGSTNDAMKRYQKRLADIDSIIDGRNKLRTSYAHLKPVQIPQSINI